MKCKDCNEEMILSEETCYSKYWSCVCGNTSLRITGSVNFGIGTPDKKLDIKKYRKTFKQKIVQFLIWLLWIFADDMTKTQEYFGKIYNDVPDDLRDVSVRKTYIYQYHTPKRNKIVKWINEDE